MDFEVGASEKKLGGERRWKEEKLKELHHSLLLSSALFFSTFLSFGGKFKIIDSGLQGLQELKSISKADLNIFAEDEVVSVSSTSPHRGPDNRDKSHKVLTPHKSK